MTKIFLVVGMHRSATSLLARGLYLSDVHMGDDLLPASPSNVWGHYEDKPIIAINDHILKFAGGRWDLPPSYDDIVAIRETTHFEYEIKKYVQSRQSHELWGMKDPRLALTWPLWLPHLDGDLHVMWTRRSADEVARSLNERDGMPIHVGRRLARTYEDHIMLLMNEVCK